MFTCQFDRISLQMLEVLKSRPFFSNAVHVNVGDCLHKMLLRNTATFMRMITVSTFPSSIFSHNFIFPLWLCCLSVTNYRIRYPFFLLNSGERDLYQINTVLYSIPMKVIIFFYKINVLGKYIFNI